MLKNGEKKEDIEKASQNKQLNNFLHRGLSDKKRSPFADTVQNHIWTNNLWKYTSANLVYNYKNPERNIATPQYKNDKTIRFNSHFESGNLMYAYKLSPDVYHCILNNDLSKECQCQWFYFQMSNIQIIPNSNRKITFFISGFSKSNSVISNGWKVFMHSERLAREKSISWHRVGTNYSYGVFKSSEKKLKKNCFTLQFQISFPYENDTVYLCYGIPYTYSILNGHISKWVHQSPILISHKTLCQTKKGNNCPLLTITANNSTANKKCIFLIARNHPGESNSSFVLHGLIDFLLSNDPASVYLLQNFIFQIIPMVNVDGVIDGNYHVGNDGEDLNKVWNNPNFVNHPTVFHIKKLMKENNKEFGIAAFIDFHGTSSSHGTFLRGCPYSPSEKNTFSDLNKEKLFPKILSRLCNSFSLDKCQLSNDFHKNGSASYVVRREFGVLNSFSFKTSFGGFEDGILANSLFNEYDWREMGAKVGESLFHLLSDKPSNIKKSIENSRTFSNYNSPRSKLSNSFERRSDSVNSNNSSFDSKEDLLEQMKMKAMADEEDTVIAIETDEGFKIISGKSNLNQTLNYKPEPNKSFQYSYSPSKPDSSFSLSSGSSSRYSSRPYLNRSSESNSKVSSNKPNLNSSTKSDVIRRTNSNTQSTFDSSSNSKLNLSSSYVSSASKESTNPRSKYNERKSVANSPNSNSKSNLTSNFNSESSSKYKSKQENNSNSGWSSNSKSNLLTTDSSPTSFKYERANSRNQSYLKSNSDIHSSPKTNQNLMPDSNARQSLAPRPKYSSNIRVKASSEKSDSKPEVNIKSNSNSSMNSKQFKSHSELMSNTNSKTSSPIKNNSNYSYDKSSSNVSLNSKYGLNSKSFTSDSKSSWRSETAPNSKSNLNLSSDSSFRSNLSTSNKSKYKDDASDLGSRLSLLPQGNSSYSVIRSNDSCMNSYSSILSASTQQSNSTFKSKASQSSRRVTFPKEYLKKGPPK